MFKVYRFNLVFRNMPIPHPRSLGVTPGALLDSVTGHPRGWAPPGWHWEVLPAGGRRLVRNPGVVVDPDLLWWRPSGPGAMQREPAPDEVVQRRVREEDEHVRRYMHILGVRDANTWQLLQAPYPRYSPMMVPTLWVHTSCGSVAGARRLR